MQIKTKFIDFPTFYFIGNIIKTKGKGVLKTITKITKKKKRRGNKNHTFS